MDDFEKVKAIYNFVKEEIKYGFPVWGSTDETLKGKTGHCGAKSELLVSILREQGIVAQYVEGHTTGLRPLVIMKFKFLDTHFWVEAKVDNEWLTLDPSPDSGITNLWGDTIPGMHLGNPKYIQKWDELPLWYKEGYNSRLLLPFRILSNMQIDQYRIMKEIGGK